MNRLPACIFEVSEMGNKKFSWSGLNVVRRANFVLPNIFIIHTHKDQL